MLDSNTERMLGENDGTVLEEVERLTVPVGEGRKMPLAVIDPNVKGQIKEYLGRQGYEVTENARLLRVSPYRAQF